MRKILWIWSIPDHYSNKKTGEYIQGSGTDRFVFREGRRLEDSIVSPKVVFECSKKHLKDVLPNSGFLLLVSKKVVGILEELCPNDIQVFEAEVYAEDQKIPGYYLLNLVHLLEVINKEESEFTKIPGYEAIMKFERIVYRFDELPHHHIVRNRDYKSHVIVSDALKEAFEANNIEGVQFTLT